MNYLVKHGFPLTTGHKQYSINIEPGAPLWSRDYHYRRRTSWLNTNSFVKKLRISDVQADFSKDNWMEKINGPLWLKN